MKAGIWREWAIGSKSLRQRDGGTDFDDIAHANEVKHGRNGNPTGLQGDWKLQIEGCLVAVQLPMRDLACHLLRFPEEGELHRQSSRRARAGNLPKTGRDLPYDQRVLRDFHRLAHILIPLCFLSIHFGRFDRHRRYDPLGFAILEANVRLEGLRRNHPGPIVKGGSAIKRNQRLSIPNLGMDNSGETRNAKGKHRFHG